VCFARWVSAFFPLALGSRSYSAANLSLVGLRNALCCAMRVPAPCMLLQAQGNLSWQAWASHVRCARCVTQAVTHYNDPAIRAEGSSDLGEPMVGIDCR
jgi:hypothetical protein